MSADYGRVKGALRNLSLEESLIHLWHYSRLISDGVPLPLNYRHIDGRGVHMRLERHAFPHQIDLLGRELMLHADRSGRPGSRSLAVWGDLAAAMNAIRYYGNEVFDGEKEGGVLLTLHRAAHQQFPRYSRLTKSKVGRYLALYRFESLAPYFEKRINIDVRSYFAMAFATIGASNQRPCSNIETDYSTLGVDRATSGRFFARIVGTTSEIREKLICDQRLGDCWEYTFNALHFKPLVAFDAKHPERVISPLPRAVESRLTEGVFYDVFAKGDRFEQGYGEAVEYIVGRMLTSLPSTFSISKPAKEQIGKHKFDGVDWIVEQGGYRAYIECKAKRLALPGRVAEKVEDLHSELDHLADAVIQNYRNIIRATRHEDATQGGLGRVFSVVVTLEDWLLFSPINTETLERLVTERLIAAELPLDLMERVPFLIFGTETFQHATAAMATSSMSEVLGGLDAPRFKGWLPATYLQDRFPDVDSAAVGDFERDFEAVIGSLVSDARIRQVAGS